MSEAEATNEVAALTVQLLSAYLANNTVASGDLAGLIRSTKEALTGEASADAQSEPEIFTPAVSVRKSLASREHIISLIDGRPYKTLKRHLISHGLTPDAYRTRYNLPAGYPMVAPAYADKRREVAQQLGLGRRKPGADHAETSGAAQEGLNGSAEPQTSDAALPAAETKPDRAPEAKKGRGRSARPTDAKNLDPVVALSAVPTGDVSTSGKAATSTPSKGTQSEAPSSSKRQAKAVGKKAVGTPARMKGAASSRGKSKAASGTASEPAAEVPAASQTIAADEQSGQPAQERKRRAKLGVFKNSDKRTPGGATDEGADAGPSTRDPAVDVAAASTPTKRQIPKRMARGTEASQNDRPNGAPIENKPGE